MTKPINNVTACVVRDMFDYRDGALYWKHQRVGRGHRHDLSKPAGGKNGSGYINIRVNGRIIAAHRLIWLHQKGVWPEHFLDHINGVRDDNRIENLREASNAENTYNAGASKNNSTGFKGVSMADGKYYRARIDNKHIGLFRTPEEAHEAYKAAAKIRHGEFARFE